MSGGTNDKIKASNKQVGKQYNYDRRMHDFTAKTNQLRYEQAVADTQLQQANYDAQLAAKDAIKVQDYQYQQDLQQRQFDVDNDAYQQSLDDYDDQVQLNSMSAAIANEAAVRANQEALISRNFGLEEEGDRYQKNMDALEFQSRRNFSTKRFAEETEKTDRESLDSKKTFLGVQDAKDQEEITNQKIYLDDASNRRQNIFQDQRDKLDADITYLNTSQLLDAASIRRVYNKEQASNFNERIGLLVKRERALGKARASGREGLSADRESVDALSEYGRSQAKFVESLVFAADQRDDDLLKSTTTTDYKTSQTGIDLEINRENRELDTLTKNREISKLDISSAKLTNALTQNKAQIDFDKDRVKAQYEKSIRDWDIADREKQNAEYYEKQRNDLAKRRINTTYDSAAAQVNADVEKIKLDEYAANLSAQGRVLQKPKLPVPLPKPLQTPRTILPVPQAPFKAPKPIKGALGKTSVWNDVGDVANVGLSIAGLFI